MRKKQRRSKNVARSNEVEERRRLFFLSLHSNIINLTLLSLAMSDETSSEPAPPPGSCCCEAEGSSEPSTRATMSAIGIN